MKKIVFLAVLLVLVLISCAGCYNRQLVDLSYHFNRAIIYLPNGQVIDGKLNSWLDFEDGDSIQVKIDGKTYLTHICNVCLISE